RQDVRRNRLTLDAVLFRFAHRRIDEAAHVVRRDLIRLRHGVTDDRAPAQIELPLHLQKTRHFRYSSVLGRSSSALAPAQTTATGVRASSSRSAEMSKLTSAPRCTPPIPPVANTLMPARCAQIMVAATVVAPIFFVATA